MGERLGVCVASEVSDLHDELREIQHREHWMAHAKRDDCSLWVPLFMSKHIKVDRGPTHPISTLQPLYAHPSPLSREGMSHD